MSGKKIFLFVLLIFAICPVKLWAGEVSAPPEISAEAAIVIDAETGVIVYEKNKDAQHYPASITKVMTALLALEEAEMDEKVVFSHDAVFSLPYNSSHIAMDEDESLSMENCLYALLLQSANEVANAIGEHIGGSKEGFAKMMTEKAKELGAKNTHFLNPSGLHEEGHYTSAYDMSLIMKEAVKNEKFLEFITTRSMKLPPTEKQPEQRPLNNTHKMINVGGPNYYEDVVGGKTGFTSEAGNTLVTLAQRGGDKLIAVILHDTSAKSAYDDTAALFDYAFPLMGDVKVFDASAFSKEADVVDQIEGETREVGKVALAAKESLTFRLPQNFTASDIVAEYDINYQLDAPVREGQKAGSVKISYKGTELGSVNIFTAHAVDALPLNAPEGGNDDFSGGGGVVSFLLSALKATAIALLILVAIGVSARLIRYNKRKKRLKLRRRKNDDYSMRNYRVYRYRDN